MNTISMKDINQIPTKDITQIFAQDQFTSIDMVHPITGRGVYSGETLEEIQKRHPGAKIANMDEWIAENEKALCTEPQEITKEQYWECLEVLPPENWITRNDNSTFKMCEYLSGRVTTIYCRLGVEDDPQTKYFCFNGVAYMKHDEIVEKCKTGGL